MTDQSIVMMLGFAVTLIAVVTPIVKLNSTITKLNVTLETFQEQTEKNHKDLSERVKKHGEEIDELKEICIKNEEKIKMYHKE